MSRARSAAILLGSTAAVLVVLLVLLSGGPSSGKDGGTATAVAPVPNGGVDPSKSAPRRTAAEQRHAALTRLAAKGRPVYCGGKTKRMVALTFDDGPGPYTHYVLNRLRRNKLRATFFLVSRNLRQFGDLVAKELEHGTVADHTQTHANLGTLSAEQQREEMVGAQQLIAKEAERDVQLFRPPYGMRTPSVDRIAKQAGMVQVLWSVDSADSAGENYAGIKKTVIAGLKPGAIILLHDNRGQTVRVRLGDTFVSHREPDQAAR